MIRALVFDFDGLILDTEESILIAWKELYEEYGLTLPFDEWAKNIGTAEPIFDPVIDLEHKLGRLLDREQVLAGRRQRETELILAQQPLPGVWNYLEEGKRLGLKIGLASSSTCRWVIGHLDRLGLASFFDCIQASDDVLRTKPDPALYQTALACLDVQPFEAIAFEDSPHGIQAAKAAGMFCVAVPTRLTISLAIDQADLCLASLADMGLNQLLSHFGTLPPNVS